MRKRRGVTMDTTKHKHEHKPTRLYLAGPMSNIPQLNFPLFHAEADRLRMLGYDIVNPAEINGGADELTATASMTPAQLAVHWLDCMRADVKQLVDCDGVALLPGWQHSRGVTVECELAKGLGLLVCHAAHLIYPAASVDEERTWLAWSAQLAAGAACTPYDATEAKA